MQSSRKEKGKRQEREREAVRRRKGSNRKEDAKQ